MTAPFRLREPLKQDLGDDARPDLLRISGIVRTVVPSSVQVRAKVDVGTREGREEDRSVLSGRRQPFFPCPRLPPL